MFIRIQEPALKTWKRVSHILNSLWSKLYQPLPAIEVSKVELNVWNAREMWGLCVFGWDKVKISRFSWLFWSREWRGASRNSMASSCQKLKHSIHFFGQFHLHSRQLYIALFQKVDADSRNIFNKRLCRQFPWINCVYQACGNGGMKAIFLLNMTEFAVKAALSLLDFGRTDVYLGNCPRGAHCRGDSPALP